MYLKGEVEANKIEDAIKIPRNLLIDQKAVYVVEADSILRYQEVEVLKITADAAIIKGLYKAFYNGKVIPDVVNISLGSHEKYKKDIYSYFFCVPNFLPEIIGFHSYFINKQHIPHFMGHFRICNRGIP